MQQLRIYLSPVLALLLMVSTVGITLNKHYCMGRLAEVSVLHKADNCAEKMGLEAGTPCPMDCCHDTEEHFQVDQYQLTSFQFDFEHAPSFLLPINFLEVDERATEAYPLRKLRFHQYEPPLIAQDLPILHDTFLI